MKKYRVKKDNKMKWFGDTDTTKKIIRINIKKSKQTGKKRGMLGRKVRNGEVLDTILHETLHAKHPKKSEREITKLTPKVSKKLSKRSKNKLYGLIK